MGTGPKLLVPKCWPKAELCLSLVATGLPCHSEGPSKAPELGSLNICLVPCSTKSPPPSTMGLPLFSPQSPGWV